MTSSSKERFHRSVFRRVIARYDEYRSVQGTNSCAGFYKGLASETQRVGLNPKIITVTPSDFIADVELAARRSLTEPNEYFVFKRIYLEKDDAFERELEETLGVKRLAEIKHAVQEKVGKELHRRKIYPMEKYLKPIDVR